jgi:plastocyanin
MLAVLLLAPALVTNIAHITIQGSSFKPDSVRIEPGDTVRWTQKDATNHTAASTPYGGEGYWISETLTRQNPTYDRVFPVSGIYTYDCSYHAYMRGKIIVGNPVALIESPAKTPLPENEAALRDARGRAVGARKLARPPAETPSSPAFPKR